MFSTIISAVICGVESCRIAVEADVSDGLPVFSMVGYLASEVREAQDRVRIALKSAGVPLPAKRITVNLSPADMRKSGAGFDLPIAVALLAAMGMISREATEGVLIVGELSLNGEINPIRGVMELVSSAERFGCTRCIVPGKNLNEGAVIERVKVMGADHLSEVISYFKQESELKSGHINIEEIRKGLGSHYAVDFADIHGQEILKRAAEVAVSGMHNMLMIGPPGAGKTMTAKRIPTILPEPSVEEMIEITKLHSIAGALGESSGFLTERPFRSPHHTVSPIGLVGGGRFPKPGEVSLAHCGVLYLDELPEFQNSTLEILRQPMEDGCVHITRNTGNYIFPADFMMVASMNPCKCGYYPDVNRCSCSRRDVKRYLDHISQPLLDRIDICVEAHPVKYTDMVSSRQEECSAVIRKRVMKAQELQRERYRGTEYRFNSDISAGAIRKYCRLGKEEEKLMRETFDRLDLTARAYGRILKVSRTIADLADSEQITTEHLAEALCYRALDKKYWTGRR